MGSAARPFAERPAWLTLPAFRTETIMSGMLIQLVGLAQGAAGGGLPALLQQLEAVGLGPEVQSWIGHGENLPVTPEQLGQAIPREHIEAWAKEANTTPEALLKVLAEALPELVHQATPEGKLPADEGRVAQLIHRLFGR